MSLVERSETFDALLSDIAVAIERGDDPRLALDDHGITDREERELLEQTITTMARLHDEGRNHIWAYYTRNMVRPVVLSRDKVEVIVGNPPWLSYRNTANILRDELERQSRNLYGIWQGGRYANRQDVAGLFFARSVDLYLKDSGLIGMVMPHSALQAGQYAKWRTGAWTSKGQGRGRNRITGRTIAVDFGHKAAWDLEQLEPNTFFPVPACVVFAANQRLGATANQLEGSVERWRGLAGAADVRRERSRITDTSVIGESPYAGYARQGASIVPRCLFFVEEAENTVVIQAGGTMTVNPRRGSQDKAPWKGLDLADIGNQAIENTHVFEVHLGETVIPYATLQPLKSVLPVKHGERTLPIDANGPGGINLGGLERRMRDRWQAVSYLWETNKRPANKLDLLSRLDYQRNLSSQLSWQHDKGFRPFRIVYTQNGEPTAALINDDALVDTKLYWVTCRNLEEAHYLLAIINSTALYDAAAPLMNKGQFGARDLHRHLWKLPIPEYDGAVPLHRGIAEAGAAAALGVAGRLKNLRAQRGERLTVTIARRELRAWLRHSDEGKEVERSVQLLLKETED